MSTWPPLKPSSPFVPPYFRYFFFFFSSPFGIKVAPPWEDTHFYLALIQISAPLESNHLKRLDKPKYLKGKKLVAQRVSSMNHDSSI